MPSYRENEVLAKQMADLLSLYPTKTAIIEAAVAQLHQGVFPEQHPEPAHIVGWDRIILAQPATCSDLGKILAIGTVAYREVWSDGRDGDILSRESLVADGILDS